MTDSDTNINKINNFDIIRLLAALQVVYTHSQHHFELNGGFLEKFGKNFLYYFPGVPIFFTVSGFLIFWSYDRNSNQLLKYFRNRFLRLFPALWFCLIITIALILYDFPEPLKLIENTNFWIWIAAQISFFQFWTPDVLRFWGVGTPNGSLWTIIIEIQFYILVPIIYLLIRLFNNFRFIILLVIILTSLIINYYIGQIDVENIKYKLGGVFILPYLYNFILGVMGYLYWNKIKKFIEGKFIYWAIIYLVYINVFGNYFEFDLTSYFINTFFHLITNLLLAGLVLSFAFTFNNISNNILRHNDISYGVYIYHMIVINFFIHRGLINNLKYFIFTFLITILLAIISWFLIEKKFLKFKMTNLTKK